MSNTSLLTTKNHKPLTYKYELSQAQKMSAYYRFHAKIYDLTRWTFLFGRHWLIDWLPFNKTQEFTLLEVGCGTGHNLKYLSECFPKSSLVGIDASADMLTIAQNKLNNSYNKPELINILYGTEGVLIRQKPNAILFSYCLTMVNPGWDKLILQAKTDLTEGGIIAVVDFHNSRSNLFKKWMRKNHVRMDSHLLTFLKQNFSTVKYEIRRVYFGLWQYTLYIGKK
jgi:S-adenosylmethionine-diacylgycerolhomoserine-N-methlytransferase